MPWRITGGSEGYKRAQILLLIAVQYKQILVVNWIRIKNIIVGVAIHKYVFCLPVCKANSMSHFVNGNICLGAVSKGAGIVYMASDGKASGLNCIEVTISPHTAFRSNIYRYAVPIWFAGLDEPRIQTWTAVPGCNSFLHFGDPIRCYIPSLKRNDDFGSPIAFPWQLMITPILVL
jgi:hypothetical protein